MKKKNPNLEVVDENLQWEREVAREVKPMVATKIRRITETTELKKRKI